MNSSGISWICQQYPQGLDSSTVMDEYDFMDPFDEELAARLVEHDFHNYFSPPTNSVASSSTATANLEFPGAMYSNFTTIDNKGILHFGNLNPSHNVQQVNPVEEVVLPEVTNNLDSEEVDFPRVQPKKKKRIRPPSQTYDHIMAERRRREQLSQLFVALSALVPGLKKMDKGSILEDAIKHMKDLQERVKLLEDKAERKGMQSLVMVKKSKIVIDDDADDDEGISDAQSSNVNEQPLPEIEARVYDNQILLKIQCEKHKDALTNLICKVESLDMIVVSTNATPFGDIALDITIVAEMEKEFKWTMKEVVTALRGAL